MRVIRKSDQVKLFLNVITTYKNITIIWNVNIQEEYYGSLS